MKGMKTILLVVLLMFGGCLSNPQINNVENEYDCWNEPIQEEYNNHSYQFWNNNPMSIGNNSVVVFNHSGEIHLTLRLTAFFHNTTTTDRGYVNYTITHNNTTLMSIEGVQEQETHHYRFLNITEPIEIQVQASGTYNQSDNKPGDYYVAQAHMEMEIMICQ
jgi:hypothetical protein